MKQTSIEWLVEQLQIFATKEEMDIIEQAKEMEQVEKIKAQIEAVRAVDTYGLKHMLEYYEQQLKSE